MRKATMLGLAATLAGLIGTSAQAQASADAGKCTTIDAAALGATSASGKWIGADAAKGLPAYCEVTATLSPASGSSIGVVYRLPEQWNGKLLGLGGGGWAGNITLMSASSGLKAGYATAQTDGGHPSTSVWDTSWTSNPEAVTDFSYRAINRMTVAGKALVKSYYGQAQKRAYFHGCSTGGRMALMEAQRFPDDYDGIISEAPVYTLQVQTSGALRSNLFGEPGAAFTPEQLKLVSDSVAKACDPKDGVTDGLTTSPRSCAWSPKAIACKAGESAGPSCLSAKQIATLDTLYQGVRAPDGSYAMLPLSKGGETGWSLFIKTGGGGVDQASGGGMPGLSHLLFGDRTVDFAKLSAKTDVPAARSSAFAKMYEAKDPNLAPFFAHGGKLLMWHGESDPGPSPVATIDYVKAVQKGNAAKAPSSLRLFLAPGVGHCRGGPGADLVENVATLDSWVEKGTAPEMIVATKADHSITRPLCAWPKAARFTGKGDANDPKAYVCEAAK